MVRTEKDVAEQGPGNSRRQQEGSEIFGRAKEEERKEIGIKVGAAMREAVVILKSLIAGQNLVELLKDESSNTSSTSILSYQSSHL